jgi:hypothetical protein
VETERCKTPEKEAGVSEQFSDEGVTNFENLGIDSDGAQCGVFVPVWDGGYDSFDGGTPTEGGAKDWVTGSSLGSGVHFLSIFLVFKYNGDVLDQLEKIRVGVGDDFSVPGPKNDTTNSNSLGSTLLRGLCVFTGSHSEEESANYKICRVRLGRVSRVIGSAG